MASLAMQNQMYKACKPAEKQVKIKIEDDDGDEVTEYLPKYQEGDPQEIILQIFHTAHALDETYELCENGKAKKLVQTISRALSGTEAQQHFLEGVEDKVRYDAANVQQKLKQAEQLAGEEIFGDDAYENQLEYFESTPFPKNMKTHQAAQRLFQMNDQLQYYGSDAKSLSPRSLNRIISKKSLTGKAKLKYAESGGPKHTTKREILSTLRNVEKTTELEKEIEEEARAAKARQKLKSTGEDTTPSAGAGNEIKNPCRMHGGKHDWSECKNNPRNAKADEEPSNQATTSEKSGLREKSSKQKKDGEVNMTQTGDKAKAPVVSFDDDHSDITEYSRPGRRVTHKNPW